MPQFRPLGTVSAPADWTIPGSLDLALEAVYAHYDGTSAAGSFIPVVEILSDAGDPVVQVPQDASVAAGSSVEATWAPFLKGATASAGGATLGGAYGLYGTSGIVLGAGASVNPSWDFGFGTALLDLTNPTTPTVLTKGMYWFGVSFTGTQPWNPGAGLECHFGMTPVGPQASAIAIADSFLKVPYGFVGQTLVLSPGDEMYVQLINLDTATRTVSVQEIDVVLLAS